MPSSFQVATTEGGEETNFSFAKNDNYYSQRLILSIVKYVKYWSMK